MNLGFSTIMFIIITVLAVAVNVFATILEKRVEKKKANYSNENTEQKN